MQPSRRVTGMILLAGLLTAAVSTAAVLVFRAGDADTLDAAAPAEGPADAPRPSPLPPPPASSAGGAPSPLPAGSPAPDRRPGTDAPPRDPAPGTAGRPDEPAAADPADRILDAILEAFERGDAAGMERGYARIRALGAPALGLLLDLLASETDPRRLVVAMNALDGLKASLDLSPEQKAACAEAVAAAARKVLSAGADADLRKNAIFSLAASGSAETRDLLLGAARTDPDGDVRRAALGALRNTRDAAAAPLVVDLVERELSGDLPTRLHAAYVALDLLGREPDEAQRRRLKSCLSPDLEALILGPGHEEPGLHVGAIEVYARIMGPEGCRVLIEGLKRERNAMAIDRSVHYIVLNGAAGSAKPVLERIASDSTLAPRATEAARRALGTLAPGGK